MPVFLCLAATPAFTQTADLARPTLIISDTGSTTPLLRPMGVAVDTVGGLVIIADTGNHRIRVFDFDGYPISSFAHRVDGPRGLVNGEPKSLAVDPRGNLYVLDAMAPYIDVLDLLGNSLHRIYADSLIPSENRPASAESMKPVGIAVDSDGNLVLGVGARQSQVWWLDDRERIRQALVTDQPGVGPFGSINGLFVDARNRLFVIDGVQAPAVRVFEPDGRQILAFGLHDAGNENFSLPSAVAATEDGRIWVADEIRQTVKVFDRNGVFLGMFGGLGRGMGDMLYPSSLATNGRDRLFVLERVGARLTTYQIDDLAASVNP